MAPRIITVIGSLNIDLATMCSRIPSGGETLTATSFCSGPGGKGANQAVACARLSRPKTSRKLTRPHTETDVIVNMVGAVGGDEFGPRLISSMSGDGINTSGTKVVGEQTTGVAVIIVEEASGQNRILLTPAANQSLRPEDFLTAASLGVPLPDLIILQLEIPLSTVIQIIKTAKQAGVDVLLNPAPAVALPTEVYQGLTHLIVNESEAAILTGRSLADLVQPGFNWMDLAQIFMAKGVCNVVITLGARGAFFASSEYEKGVYVPAANVSRVVDTTAAGDTFVGAYAVMIVKGKCQMTSIIQWACSAAARTVEKKGAQDAIPWSDEVDM